jgi:hypothetical protein
VNFAAVAFLDQGNINLPNVSVVVISPVTNAESAVVFEFFSPSAFLGHGTFDVLIKTPPPSGAIEILVLARRTRCAANQFPEPVPTGMK